MNSQSTNLNQFSTPETANLTTELFIDSVDINDVDSDLSDGSYDSDESLMILPLTEEDLEEYITNNMFSPLSTIVEDETMSIDNSYNELYVSSDDDFNEVVDAEMFENTVEICLPSTPCYDCHLCSTWNHFPTEGCDDKTKHNRNYLRYAIARGRFRRVMNSTFCRSCHCHYVDCNCKNNKNIENKEVYYYENFDDSCIQSVESYLKEHFNHEESGMSSKDWAIKLIEDVSLFIMQLVRAQGPLDYTVAITMFAKLRTTGPLISSSFIEKLEQYLTKTFAQTELQSMEESLGSGRKLLESYEEIRNAPIFQKVYKFAMYAMSMSLFDKIGISFDALGYSLVEKEAIRRKYYKAPDMIHCFADTLLFLAERGYQIYKTGSIEPLFHSARSYEQWFEKAIELKRKSLLLNDPEFYGFSESEFLADLDDTLEKGESIFKHASKVGKYERTSVRNFVNDLYMIKIDYISKRKARESRKAPFSVLLSGNSGIGKSTITDLLFYHFGTKEKLPTGSEFRYTRNPVAKFWDGFSTSMWCAILDDVAFLKPSKAASGDPSCMEFLQIVNAVPFVPDQADLADKGRTPLRCKLVIATTNTEDLNAHHYFSCPSAAQRRFPFIIVPTPKQEYQNESGMLDSSKVPQELIPGCYPDLWTWTVKTVKPVPIDSMCKKAQIETIHKDVDLQTFLTWFNGAIEAFNTNQSKVSDSIKNMQNIKLCPTCSLPESMCECTQSFGQVLTSTFWSSYYLMCFIVILFQFCSYLFTAKRVFNTFMTVRRTVHRVQSWKDYIYGTYICSKNAIKPAQQSAFWRDLGSKVQEKISYPVFLGGLATAIIAGLGVLKFARVVYKLQSSDQKAPVAFSNERDNVWYRSNWEHAKFDVGMTTKTLGRKGVPTVLNTVSKNTIHFTAETKPNFGYISRGLAVDKQLYLFNNHCLPVGGFRAHVVKSSRSEGVNSNFSFDVTESQIYRDTKNDLALIRLSQLPPAKNIVKLFSLEGLDVRANGFYVSREASGEVVTSNITCATLTHDQKLGNTGAQTNVWLGNKQQPTEVGDCGIPLVLDTQMGPVIAGIHALGRNLSVGATAVTQQWLIKAINELKPLTLSTSHPKLSAPSAPQELGQLHHKSVFRFIEDGTANVYGSLKGFRAPNKSRVQTTPMADVFSKHGYVAKHTKPVLRGWEPWRIAALSMVNPVSELKDDILQECVESYFQDIMKLLPKSELAKLEVYDDFTAVNGAAGVSYVDAMNRATSAGFPWNKTKRAYISPCAPRGGNMDPVVPDEEIMERVAAIEQEYLAGSRSFPVFTGHLKDEPVTFKKANMSKTRVFTGAPFDWSIVMRKYLLSFIRVVQGNRFVFESAPGTVAQSKEWGDIYRYITKFGRNKIVAGDYAKFDKRMPSNVILAAFNIMARVCKESGNFDDDDLRVIMGLGTDTAFPLVNFNGDLVEFFGSNPSGHPLTVIVNGLANSLYMRYCYRTLNPKQEVTSFKDNVTLMTYGDDNIMGVSDDAPWFNHTTIVKALADIDIQYTMADKESESVPYIDVDDSSFLKRTWLWNDEIEDYLCPLDEESIEKSLMVWVESKTITNEEQMIAVIGSAAREYFFYGRETFERKRKMFLSAIQELNLQNYATDTTVPTWDSMVSMWREASAKL